MFFDINGDILCFFFEIKKSPDWELDQKRDICLGHGGQWDGKKEHGEEGGKGRMTDKRESETAIFEIKSEKKGWNLKKKENRAK